MEMKIEGGNIVKDGIRGVAAMGVAPHVPRRDVNKMGVAGSRTGNERDLLTDVQ